jgi:Icc-related predicted phosphoesterase
MRILPISDIHGKFEIFDYIKRNIDRKQLDFITISGDIWEGYDILPKEHIEKLQKWAKCPVILIQGNHDKWDNTIFNRHKHIHLLHNESVEINGVSFYGSPFTPQFCNWKWMETEENLYNMWKSTLPESVDVALFHGPPYGYCDNVNQSSYGNTSDSKLGSKALAVILNERKIKYLFCGHIHSSDKHKIHPSGTEIYNVSILDERYQFLGFNPAPKIIEINV